MDANEYALKVTPAEKSLGLVIRKAQWLGKGERRRAARAILPRRGAPARRWSKSAGRESRHRPSRANALRGAGHDPAPMT